MLDTLLVVNKDETYYFDIVFTDDDETVEMIQNSMKGICHSCHNQHKIRTRKYKPEILRDCENDYSEDDEDLSDT